MLEKTVRAILLGTNSTFDRFVEMTNYDWETGT